jgi:hypothetical protein
MRGGMSYKEIGDVLGISGARVRQIEATALRKLRRSGKLEKFLCLLDVEVQEYYGEEKRRVKHGEW